MDAFWGIAITSLWLGILTSLSPCPLASNIAAVSFLSKKITNPKAVMISGLAYTAGRMASYAAVGWIIIHSLASVPQVAMFLQKYMGKALGPLLVLTGLILFEAIQFQIPGFSLSQKQHRQLAEGGVPGAFLLGFIFALAFCPVSAALYFGSLIPMALHHAGGSLLPLIYGIGSGLPVMAFAAAIAGGVSTLSHWFRRLAKIESYTRKITGLIFIGAGIYYLWAYWLSGAGI